YRTGDMVRVLSDGSLGVVGRRDSQVKIRGNRVELSEIEAVIREIDYVDDVTVQTIKRGTNNEVVAYVVATGEFDDEELKENISNYVDERKPEYMIPSFVIRLDEIPLNVNGKVDKRALPEVDVEELKVEYVAPTTETEKLIVNAFEEVFNQENIGIYDDFVRMGGDSLTAIKMTSILSKSGISVNAHVIFDNKTPYQIAKFIDDDQGEYGFYLAKEGIQNQNMFILPPLGGLSMVFSPLLDNLEFEGNVYLIDDFKYDLTVDEIKNTDHNMTFEKYWNAIKDIFQDGDIIAGYSLGCLFAILIAEKLEKDRKIEKCVLIDGALDFYSDDIPDNVDASDIFKELTDLGFDIDELGGEDNDELSEKMVEMFYVNSVWDFQPVKINDTPVIYLATEHGDEGKLENIARNGEFIFIDDTDHTAIITDDVEKIVKYLK
ncbi:AMP-binding enzyme, partial [Methanobrevibacter sp.]|uniref:AMP-binding enzyme n=1 Tax=Methanobrevibacter sp. TaxID=66852 RepID=UPI00388EC1EF